MATETYQLCISGLDGNNQVQNCLHFTSDNAVGNDTLGDAENLIAAWDANIKTAWLACLPNSYILMSLSARRVIPKVSATAWRVYPLGITAGTRGVQSTSDQVCPCVFLIPPMGVKSGGKVFMPSVTSTDLKDNSFIAAFIALIDTLFALMEATFSFSGRNWKIAIHSRKTSSAAAVMGHQLSPVIGFQNRRRIPI